MVLARFHLKVASGLRIVELSQTYLFLFPKKKIIIIKKTYKKKHTKKNNTRKKKHEKICLQRSYLKWVTFIKSF